MNQEQMSRQQSQDQWQQQHQQQYEAQAYQQQQQQQYGGGPMEQQFRNVDPQSREQRAAEKMGGSVLEKHRLRQQGHDVPENPMQQNASSPAYADDATRFQRDYAGHQYHERLATQAKQQAIYESRRAESYQREQTRWDHENRKYEDKETFLAAKRGDTHGATRNTSGAHYNILTLGNNQSVGGEQLTRNEEATRGSAAQRAQQLYQHGHSVSHNIINNHPNSYPGQ